MRFDVMLDLTWRRFSDIWQDKRELESKAGILLASNGILLCFVANAWKMLNPELALIGIICLWLSTVFCVLALKTRKYKEFDLEKAWKEYNEYFDDVNKLKLGIYSTLKEWEKLNHNNVTDVAKWYSRGVWLFLGSITCIMISLLMPFLFK